MSVVVAEQAREWAAGVKVEAAVRLGRHTRVLLLDRESKTAEIEIGNWPRDGRNVFDGTSHGVLRDGVLRKAGGSSAWSGNATHGAT